jgi:hypothetical protein
LSLFNTPPTPIMDAGAAAGQPLSGTARLFASTAALCGIVRIREGFAYD